MRDSRDGQYDTAQICLNGHVINWRATSLPQHNQKYCAECGRPTISACPNCNAPIRGYYRVSGGAGYFYNYNRRNYCHECGKPYPWTVASLEAARELAGELKKLTAEEQEQLKETLPDLVAKTPRTVVAETRFKRFMKKAGPEAYDGMKAILTNVVSEAVRKSLFG